MGVPLVSTIKVNRVDIIILQSYALDCVKSLEQQ